MRILPGIGISLNAVSLQRMLSGVRGCPGVPLAPPAGALPTGALRPWVGPFRSQAVLWRQAKETEMSAESRKVMEERLLKLRAELEERKSSIPIHSIRPHQLIEIEELEEEIEALEKQLEGT